jgi:S1-C subfamily serine protease
MKLYYLSMYIRVVILFIFALSSTAYAQSAANLYKRISRNVVVIFAPDGQGSGVLLSPKIVATNCHVVERHSEVTVEFFGERKSARIVGRNDLHDVCVLELASTFANAQPVIGARRVTTIEPGETIYVIGAPVGYKYTMTSGIVSQTRAHKGGTVVQFDASISNGNSGGGLFDTSGRLLGLPSFSSGRDGTVIQNLNFAWSVDVFPSPANSIIASLTDLTSNGAVTDSRDPPIVGKNSVTQKSVDRPDYAIRWTQAFESADYRNAYTIASEWISTHSLSADAFVARGRSSESIRPGSGAKDFDNAIKIDHSHQSALYYAALSSRSVGDVGYFRRYKNMLKVLNPQLANTLP